MSIGAIPVARGCGTRKPGGLYWELGISDDGGLPASSFLLDPPVLVPADVHLPPLGMIPFVGVSDGVPTVHFFDRVGLVHYPNAPDFIEEMARFGASRKIPKPLLKRVLDVPKIGKRLVSDLLTEKSRLMLIHDRATFARPLAMPGFWRCFNGRADHAPDAYKNDPLAKAIPPCLGATWFDLIAGEDVNPDDVLRVPIARHIVNMINPVAGPFLSAEDEGLVRRVMPSFEYYGVAQKSPPKNLKKPYVPAVFASLPCSRLAIVEGPDDEKTLELARLTSVTAEIVAE